MARHGQLHLHPNEPLPVDSLRKLHGLTARREQVRLALAVLEDAIGRLEGSQDPWNFPPRLFRWESEQWIESRDRAPLFSFEKICSILHLDAEHVRSEIRRWRAQQSEKPTAFAPILAPAASRCDSVPARLTHRKEASSG